MNSPSRSGKLVCIALLLTAAACNGAESGTDNGSGHSGSTTSGLPTAGKALAIGLNAVDPAHYGGWSGVLGGCEPDARDMRDIANAAGIPTTVLLTQQATRQHVLDEIAAAATQLKAYDLFVLSYSGHGGQLPDVNGDDSDDDLDETWCLFDGELLDDELNIALSAFVPNVRVLVFSDSCHSGTVVRVKAADFQSTTDDREIALRSEWATKGRSRQAPVMTRAAAAPATLTPKALPPDIALRTYRQNKPFYDRIGAVRKKQARGDDVLCHVILISGCEDQQLSADIGSNGLFTLEVKQVWNNGNFSGGHKAFQTAVRSAVVQSNPSQEPDLFTIGTAVAGYEAQKPYTMVSP